MKQAQKILLGFIVTAGLSACNSVPNSVAVNGSYLQKSNQLKVANDSQTQTKEEAQAESKSNELVYLPALPDGKVTQTTQPNLSHQFSDTEQVKLTADSLKVKDYLHYVFGDLLGVNYIIGDAITSSDDAITINLKEQLSKRRLFSISQDLLTERGIVIRQQDDVFYIHPSENATGGNVVYGYGNKVADVPNTANTIIHLAPFKSGMQTPLANTIRQMTNVDAQPLFDQHAIMFKGKRAEVVRALEFMQMMDKPAFRDRHIGMYKSVFMPAKELSQKLGELLKQEGITSNSSGSTEQAVSMVTIERTNSLVFFTNNDAFLQRVAFWSQQLDQPADSNEKQYFIFEPEFARAVDLGLSLQNLLGGGSNSGLNRSTSVSNETQEQRSTTTNNVNANISVNNQNLRMVVDERSNAIIFHTSGADYRNILPLVKRLDVMPKQVVLEVLIAEVSLTDEFSQGVKFALANNRTGQTGYYNIGGNTASGLNYVLEGLTGKLDIQLFEKNQNVNVLSRPTISVRDGVEASIAVGDEIPTTGEIVTDPVNGSRTSVVYRETGIDLNVTPTVNAQGVILMEIEQEISNDASGDDSTQGQPTIFKRKIKTEVIAADGQTIMLGGLISQNNSITDTGVPFFSDLPIIGRLFDGKKDTKSKTELVVMVTPRIVEASEQWQGVMDAFQQNLTSLDFDEKTQN
ncbi:secretin N-terminal domain-containing protein [Pseudoalteromonas sp. S16_S37]|uniref:secretin N-terminal domain-containing protein n=1 Tax=Pseudoalteromonas sp. S16_S37 TaxID=2720228 RepID=UPI0016809965|nr:secretin N-terminal domain-containing protein [Pseudoalteromonas sp. S16_S37]MBD1580971.1 Type II secretory pathway component PulD-like protein [Pseudoalteromonas sp. S16_S37]